MKQKIKRVPKRSSLGSGIRSNSPFGLTDSADISALKFKGTADQLSQALEQSFQPKPAKSKPKTKPKADPSPVPIPKSKVRSKTKPVKKAPKPFDRNRDGASEVEIERARHLITNVVEVPKALRLAFARKLQRITKSMTNYFLMEVAPYESGLNAALSDASESLRLMTGLQSADFSLGSADRHLRRLTELKTLDWVCEKLKLPADIRQMVLHDYMGIASVGNQVKPTSKELHELRKHPVMPRSEEGRTPRMSTSQVHALGRSVVDAIRRETRKAGKAG